jgi:Mobilization protein NikA
MARPKKQPAERRMVSLSCRVTALERLRIDTAAAQAGLSASEYIRQQALRGRVIVAERRTLDPAAFDQLRRIGVNLNQLTRVAHSSGEIPPEMARAAAAVERVIASFLTPEPGPAVPQGGDDEPSGDHGSDSARDLPSV